MARILAIDDDADILRILGIILPRGGHTVGQAANGDDGLAMLRAEPFDLVICDVMMPGKDGYQVIREIRADPARKDILILAFTARAQPVDFEAALEAGADACLAKPISNRELLDKINAMVSVGRPKPAAAQPQGRVIVCLGLRGGAGATTLVANLGAVFTRARRRVCLIDLSPASGHLALHFRLRPRPNWADLPPEVDGKALGAFLLKHQAGLYLLAAPSQPVRRGLSGAAFERVLTALRQGFDEIVVDAAPLLDDATMIALQAAAPVVIILTPEVASVQTTTGTLRALAEAAVDAANVRLVLNQTTPENALPQVALEKALARALDAALPYERAQVGALMQGVPLGFTRPASPLVTAIEMFASRL